MSITYLHIIGFNQIQPPRNSLLSNSLHIPPTTTFSRQLHILFFKKMHGILIVLSVHAWLGSPTGTWVVSGQLHP